MWNPFQRNSREKSEKPFLVRQLIFLSLFLYQKKSLKRLNRTLHDLMEGDDRCS